ncbi:gonadotropin-releasing hormone receptor-like [Dreissena polymorpha]|uniref:gonadotropin-releasing hormone receptor-like n=1 Tax=Dreissena polymorpha TaxID=45954 RepID=UPI0022649870|nr:gonadotropin-releasing hormone receptor-like [Dreissena polymorpha]
MRRLEAVPDTMMPLDLQNALKASHVKGDNAAFMSIESRQGFATIQQRAGSFVAISVVCLLMAAVIISLNGLVIIILARQKGNNRLHFFIFHLAIADLCVGLVSVLGEGVFYGILRGEWFLGDVMCRTWRYSTFVVLIVSNNLLIGMSVDRYLAVRYPLRAITGALCLVHTAARVLHSIPRCLRLLHLHHGCRLEALEGKQKSHGNELYTRSSTISVIYGTISITKHLLFLFRRFRDTTIHLRIITIPLIYRFKFRESAKSAGEEFRLEG